MGRSTRQTCIRNPRRDRIDLNIMANPLCSQGAGKMKNTGFRNAIGGLWLRCVNDAAGHGGGEDDGAIGLAGNDISASSLTSVSSSMK